MSVEQGYIASNHENSSLSEGICVNYNPETVNLQLLIEVHLTTHKSTKNHSMRHKYRFAIYTFSEEQKINTEYILNALNLLCKNELVTFILNCNEFIASRDEFTNYYYSNPEKPFCVTFINPKLKLLLEHYSGALDIEKLDHLKFEPTLQ